MLDVRAEREERLEAVIPPGKRPAPPEVNDDDVDDP
jgi:hypothetical protein